MKQYKEDKTVNKYGTVLREYIGKRTFRSLESELGLCEGAISALVNGKQFMAEEIVNKLLDLLNIPRRDREYVLSAIAQQKITPVVTDIMYNAKLRAHMHLNALTCQSITSSDMGIQTVTTLKNGKQAIGPKRLAVLEKTLGRVILPTNSERLTTHALVSKYTEEELALALAYCELRRAELKHLRKTKTDIPLSMF